MQAREKGRDLFRSFAQTDKKEKWYLRCKTTGCRIVGDHLTHLRFNLFDFLQQQQRKQKQQQ